MKRSMQVLLIACALSAAGAAKQGEMERYREITERPTATVQDMVDLIFMDRGDFTRHASEKARCDLARHEGWLGTEQAEAPLDRGTLAYAIVRQYNVTAGWLFRLTGLRRYALRDVQEAGILSVRFSEANPVSGAQLTGALSAAGEYKTQKEEWSSRH